MKSNNSAGRACTTGNHVKLTTADAFSSGQISGLILTETSDGAILRMESSGEAFYLSQIFETEKPFNDLVASWNAETPEGSYAEIFARVYLPEYDGWTDPAGIVCDGWSDWISWGK